MATLERLLIRIEADTRELRAQMAGAGAIVEAENRKIETSWSGVDRAVRAVRNQVAGVLGAYVGVRAVIGFVGELAERAIERHAELAGATDDIGESWESIQNSLADILAGPMAGMLAWADEFLGKLAVGADALQGFFDDMNEVPNAENLAERRQELAEAEAELARRLADPRAGTVQGRQFIDELEKRVAALKADVAAIERVVAVTGGGAFPPLPFEKPFHEAPKGPAGRKPAAPDIVLAPLGATRMEQILAGTAEAREALAEAQAEAERFLAAIETAMLLATGRHAELLEREADAELDRLRRLRDDRLLTEEEWREGVRLVHVRLFADLARLDEQRTEQERREAEERARIEREKAAEIRDIVSGTLAEIRSQFMAGSFDLARIAQALLGDLAGRLFEGAAGSIFDMLGGLDFGGILGFQHGGPIGARQPAIVGEAGPELFVPAVPGTIVPNHALARGGGGSVTVNQTFVLNPGASEQAVLALRATAGAIKRDVLATVVEEQRRTAGAFV